VTLHATRHQLLRRPSRAIALGTVAAAVAAVGIPTIVNSSQEKLNALQSSQQANVSDNSNLSLEQVDYSSPSAVLRNLPQRIFDVTFRPFPWQIQNASQRLGVIGGLLVLFLLAQLVRFIVRERSRIMDRAGPFIYTSGLLLVAYSLSSGNAGTSFRYRTHVVALAICAIVILRVRSAEEAEVAETSRDPARTRPLTADMRPSTAS
jgi:O-antigen ligase